MEVTAGIHRSRISPFWGVELTGWGYYLARTWQRVRDHLNATALVIENGQSAVAIISLDLMVVDAAFTQRVRAMVSATTGIAEQAVLVTCTHSHNAPAAGGLMGVGEVDPLYERWAARQAATAAILAWNDRFSARLSAAAGQLGDVTFNRTRNDGTTDEHLTTLRVDDQSGHCRALVVNYQAHPTVGTELWPRDVTRDVPGQVCDRIEQEYPGAAAIYIQGACGDVNFLRDFATPDRYVEPANRVAQFALDVQGDAISVGTGSLGYSCVPVRLPTRRWSDDEIQADRQEAERRLKERDVDRWETTIGRSMTNRPQDMVRRHGGDVWKAVAAMCRFQLEWTRRMPLERAEWLATEVQTIRIGDLVLIANSAELFSTWALQVRDQWSGPWVVFACYSNGRIGYLPDAEDIAAGRYASLQSPKFCLQFPFTPDSGAVLVDDALAQLRTL